MVRKVNQHLDNWLKDKMAWEEVVEGKSPREKVNRHQRKLVRIWKAMG